MSPMRRRSPLARAAVVGGVAHHAGKKGAQQQAAANAQAQQSADIQPPPPAAAPISGPPVKELNDLAKLRDDGVLTQEEFDAEKARLLGH